MVANNSNMKKPTGFVTVKQAAKIIGVVEQRIRQMTAAGEIESIKIAGIWLIDAADARRVARQPSAIGKPRGAKNVPKD